MTKQLIILTGGDSFIGHSIIKLYKNDYDFIVLKRKGSPVHYPEIQEHAKIFYSISAMENAPVDFQKSCGLIMLGGARPYIRSENNVKDIKVPETESAKKIFEFCERRSVKNIVFASSKSIYGKNDVQPFEEINEPHPDTLYGLNKFLIEQLGFYHAQKSGFKFTALRLTQVFGAGDRYKNLLVTLMRNARINNPVQLWRGVENDKRSYVYVKDAADAMIYFLKNEISGVFNIGMEKSYSPEELVQLILKNTPAKFKVERNLSVRAKIKHEVISMEKTRKFARWSCCWQMKDAIRDYWLEMIDSKDSIIPESRK